MKNLLLLTFIVPAFILAGCNINNNNGDVIDGADTIYVHKDSVKIVNPLDSIDYFFTKAKAHAGNTVALFYISGVQKTMLASKDYNLNWNLFFIKDNKIVQFIATGKVVTTKVFLVTSLPVGYEFLYQHDSRINLITPPNEIWTKCITDHNKALLYLGLFVPLTSTPSGYYYYMYTKEGISYPGIDMYIYDAFTGEDVTPSA